MRQIGIIASGSSETGARVILSEGEEKRAKAEDLVLVTNHGAGKLIAVLRGGLGSNENLKPGGYHPGVAYARIGGRPSTAKETYDFGLTVIGEIPGRIDVVNETHREGADIFRIRGSVDGPVTQNKKILAPGSPTYVFDDEDQPMELLAGRSRGFTVGHYEGHPTWPVPVDSSFIQYHVGVFASTGAGKSFLARYQLIPFLEKAGYGVVVLDWKGRDYMPHYPKEQVISITQVALDDETVISYLEGKMGSFGYSGSGGGTITQALQSFIYKGEWRSLDTGRFRKSLVAYMLQELNPKELTTGRPAEDYQRFERGYRRLKDKDVENILGKMSPSDVIAKAKVARTLIVDMKRTGKDEKLSMFLTLANHLMELMQNDEDLELALVIDEGPQYCPFKPEGIQEETSEILIDMCALGRTHRLCVCLLSQGIAGEIGINAAVRRNLNTQFVGKIHPLDILEASNWLAPFNIDAKFLLSLPPGHFYFMGTMNPSPIPLLITFKAPSG